MKVSLRDGAVLIVVLINLFAVFYWGGTTRARVDDTRSSLTSFIQEAKIEHATFQKSLMNHEGRISVTEALQTEE